MTARAVRERAGVAMGAASAAAKAWNEPAATAEQVPPAPVVVERRFEAVWREAVVAAREELAQEQAGWQVRVQAAEDERADLAELVEQVEAERDQVHTDLESVRHDAAAAAEAAATELAEARSRADRAEAQATAIAAELEKARTDLEGARYAALDAADIAARDLRHQASETARAQARAEEVEAQRAELLARQLASLEELHVLRNQMTADVTEQRSRADRAEARVEAIETERDRLATELKAARTSIAEA